METTRTIVFEKDYTYIYDEDRAENIANEMFWQAMADEGIMEEISDYRDRKPHIINPLGKALFEYMIPKSDRYAEDFGGTISAYIDYRSFEAKIDMVVPFVHCNDEWEKEFMMMALATSDVEIYPSEKDGYLLYRLNFPYFATLNNPAEDAETEAQISARIRELCDKLDRMDGKE